MKKLTLLLIILIQFLIIGIIIKNIYKKSALGVVSINPIKKDALITTESGVLKYFYEPKPNSIIKPKPLFEGIENVSYKINADGLNQIENYQITKDPNTYRIVTVGDSFTFGENVDTEDNFPSQLNKLLNDKLSCPNIKKFEVLNLGVSGYDIQYTLERFKLRGEKYKPDLLVWLIIKEDLRRQNEMMFAKAKEYKKEMIYNKEFEEMKKNGINFPEYKKAQDYITKQIGINNLLSLQRLYLNQLNAFYSGKLMLVTFHTQNNKYDNILKKYAHERKKTFFYNQIPQMSKADKTALPDFHPSKKGHSIIAESILRYLIEKDIIPCSFNN